jgi:hypothetical protein
MTIYFHSQIKHISFHIMVDKNWRTPVKIQKWQTVLFGLKIEQKKVWHDETSLLQFEISI